MYRYLVLVLPGELETPPYSQIPPVQVRPSPTSCADRRPILAAQSRHRGIRLWVQRAPSAPTLYRPDGDSAVAEAGLQQGSRVSLQSTAESFLPWVHTRPEPGPAVTPGVLPASPRSSHHRRCCSGEARSCVLPTTAGLSLQSGLTLRPHGPKHARPPCPSATPGLYSNARPSSR